MEELSLLDKRVQKRMLITLTGPSGSCKCRMLDEWARGRAKAARRDQIVMIRAIRSVKGLPMACVVFPRIWHEIQQVGRPAYQRHDDEGERITMYNARQIESLRQRIIEEAHKSTQDARGSVRVASTQAGANR
jgi:hypothetical protein